MIKFTDTAILTLTKLRTRRIRTAITVLLASLLFGVLVAASLIMTGIFKSVDDFREDGLTSRYIVSVLNSPGDPLAFQKLMRDPELIAEAKKRYKALVDAKTAEAKRLGIDYSYLTDQAPFDLAFDGEERLTIQDPNDIVYGLLKERFENEPAFDDSKLENFAKQYRAIDIFAEEIYAISKGSSLTTFKDGKEVFYDRSDEAESLANYQEPLINSSGISIKPPEVTEPFMLPGNAGWQPDGESLPIILPQNIIEQLLGMEKLPDTASANQKLDHLKNVRQKATELTFQACYRNDVSEARIQQVIQQQKEIAANKAKKDYQKPSLIYTLPDPTKCENASVVSDTRTTDEKKYDQNQELFDQRFAKPTEPISYFIAFKIVGVSPPEQRDPMPGNQENQIRNANDVINQLLKTYGIGQTVPQTLYDQLPDKTKFADLLTFRPFYFFGNEDNKQRLVEFASAHDATKFIDEQSCTMQRDNTCKPLGRPYQAMLAFSNSAAIDDIQKVAKQWFGYAMLGVSVLAAVIMWIAVGRTVTDGRRETAVFRAIGFKRIDIATVYLLYAVVLSVLTALFAAGIGWLGAYIANQRFSPGLTAQAQYSFGGLNISKEMSLIGFDQTQLATIIIACLVTGILSAIIPLLLNVRRSPIRDMREE